MFVLFSSVSYESPTGKEAIRKKLDTDIGNKEPILRLLECTAMYNASVVVG
jgi:hypothetical protein